MAESKILIDTSIWIDYSNDNSKNKDLTELIEDRKIFLSNVIYGELMLGKFGVGKQKFLNLISVLPKATEPTWEEVFSFLRTDNFPQGIGLIDLVIFLTAKSNQLQVWTRDSKLNKICENHFIKFIPQKNPN